MKELPNCDECLIRDCAVEQTDVCLFEQQQMEKVTNQEQEEELIWFQGRSIRPMSWTALYQA